MRGPAPLREVAVDSPDVHAALTWLDPELGLDLSGATGFEFDGENPDADDRSGKAFHIDVSISNNLTKEFSLGLLAGGYDQVSSGDGGWRHRWLRLHRRRRPGLRPHQGAAGDGRREQAAGRHRPVHGRLSLGWTRRSRDRRTRQSEKLSGP